MKKIKNGYRMCYECNKKDDTSNAEPLKHSFGTKFQNESLSDTTEQPYKKEQIPKCVRNALWINFFKDSRVGLCLCCKREPITISNFHAGHIKAEKNGGKTSLENLKPICPMCNLSTGTQDMDEFISRYNLHYGL
jgi:5-methylcytosine-specific restriction endonuclease McrA